MKKGATIFSRRCSAGKRSSNTPRVSTIPTNDDATDINRHLRPPIRLKRSYMG